MLTMDTAISVLDNNSCGCCICSLDMIPYTGCGMRSARAILVGSRERAEKKDSNIHHTYI